MIEEVKEFERCLLLEYGTSVHSASGGLLLVTVFPTFLFKLTQLITVSLFCLKLLMLLI